MEDGHAARFVRASTAAQASDEQELTPGQPARAIFTKYDGRPHWEFDLTILGTDEYGVWLGGGIGDVFARPGLQMQSTAHYVCLFPAQGWYVATFNDHGAAVRSRIYIDIATEPRWSCSDGDPPEVHAIDLDLDVIRRYDGELLIDDEDEFLDHQVSFGYPPDVVTAVRETADELLEAVRQECEPFGSVGFAWIETCRRLLP